MSTSRPARKRRNLGESSSGPVRERTVSLERPVKISDFQSLLWEGHSLPSIFSDRGWGPILDEREEAWEPVSYIDIVAEFYRELGSASADDSGAYSITVREVPVVFSRDGLAEHLGIPRLPDAYPNVVPRESDPSVEAETAEEEASVYTDEVDTLADHEVRDLVVGPDAPPYDGTKSIKQADLSSFFKILNLIIANNIDPRQHKTEVGIDRTKFMIRVARGIPIDLVGYIFDRIRSESRYISMDILPFGVLITRYLLCAGVVPDVAERKREPMGPINSTTLSRSTGHSRLRFRAHVPEPVDPHRDAQPGDHGVSAAAAETSTRAEASVHSVTREEMADIVRAAISEQTSAVIDAVRMEIHSAVSELRTEFAAMSATQVTISTRLTQIEERIAAVEEVCKDLGS